MSFFSGQGARAKTAQSASTTAAIATLNAKNTNGGECGADHRATTNPVDQSKTNPSGTPTASQGADRVPSSMARMSGTA
jgi:hypothetical protein